MFIQPHRIGATIGRRGFAAATVSARPALCRACSATRTTGAQSSPTGRPVPCYQAVAAIGHH